MDPKQDEKQTILGEDYQLLLAGRRIKSNRNTSQTVSEREKKLQMEQFQQTIAKKREKSKKKQKAAQSVPALSKKAQQPFKPTKPTAPLPSHTPELKPPTEHRKVFSPVKQFKIVRQVVEKDILEQIAECQVLDKVIPCLDFVEGVYVQNNSEFSQIRKVAGRTLHLDSAQVDVSQVKFLSDAFYCQLLELDLSKASERMIADLYIQGDLEQSVVLVQAVSLQTEQSAESIHRLHALTINQVGKLVLYPITFKPNSKFSKRLLQQRLGQHQPELCYPKDSICQIIDFGLKIQFQFADYKQKVQSIRLTENNHGTLMFAFCRVADQIGFITRIHKDQAFIRLLRVKDDQVPQAWYSIQDNEILADLTMGYISLSTLSQSSIYDIRFRKIQFVSQIERDAQIVVPAQHDGGCKVCKYPKVLGINSLVCQKCTNFFHEKCLAEYQVKSQDAWYCPDCIKCNTCLGCSDTMLVCGKCNFAVHADCIDLQYKHTILAQQTQKPQAFQESIFRCEDCIECSACGCTKDDKWSEDFKLCQQCDKKRDQKLFCCGCLRFMPEDQITNSGMLRCASCEMWMHKTCDRMLEDPAILQKFDSGILYACVACRQKSRADFIDQIVDFMISEDKKNEFLGPFWLQAGNAQYLSIIKEPICFQNIKDELNAFEPNFYTATNKFNELKYLSKPEQFRADIERIFRNAKTFNPISNEIHKLAIRMQEKCNQILSQGRIWEIFEINSKVTLDELRNLKYLRGLVQEPNYQLKPKDLYLMYEQIDIRQFQYLLQTSLGKRSRDQSGTQQKRLKIDEQQEIVIETKSVEHRKIMHEANKRLLMQNLGNLIQNLHNKQLQIKNQPQLDYEQQLSPKSRWKALVDDLRTSDERDSCWYSSPVRVSFDDPTLMFEEMCYLCGAFGLKEDFLGCNFCGESFHPYCLPCPKESKQGLQEHWFCYNCIFCEKCHSSRQWEFLVLCAVCDKADHFQCLEPQLIQVPECSWKCPDCFKCRTCGTKDFFSEEDIRNKINLDPNEKYILSFDFEFCYQCGQNEYRKSFCNICKSKTGLGLEPLQLPKKNYFAQIPLVTEAYCTKTGLFKCTRCKFYCHLDCSRTSEAALAKIPNYQGFQCLDCLLSDRQPGFYLHEQCELYQNLNDRLLQYQVFKELCNSTLANYTTDDFIITSFVTSNTQWLQSDSLIQKWIRLLKTEVESDDSTIIDDAQITTAIDSEIESLEMRDLYTSLYIKNNSSWPKCGQIPEAAFNPLWLKPIDFTKLYQTIEYTAVMHLRYKFVDWLKNDIVKGILSDQGAQIHKTQQLVVQSAEQLPEINEEMEEVQEMCSIADEAILNPQMKLTCILCQKAGEKRVTGRLIPFQVNQFVHVNCAMWTAEVQEGTEDTVVSSELYNFFFAFKHFRHNKCAVCDLKGATLICANHQATKKCPAPYYHFPCAYASGQVSFQSSIEIFCQQCSKKEKDVQIGLPLKFQDYHRRRVLIVKNLTPQCTTAFSQSGQLTLECDQDKTAQQQYIVNCNKWRPFYYDMFNRAGNLTILSLSEQANAVVESLHNLSHQKNTWHTRFKKQVLQEQQSAFASLRIFWNDQHNKSYYLFNQNTVRVFDNPNLGYVADFIQKLCKQKLTTLPQQITVAPIPILQFWERQIQSLRRRYKNFSQDSTYLTAQMLCGLDKYPIQFWNNPMEKVGLPLRDMNIVNFFYKSAERVIKIQQLYPQQNQEQSMAATDAQMNLASAGGLHQIFQQVLKANKYVNQDGLTYEEALNLKNPKYVHQNLTEYQLKQVLGSLDHSQPVLNQLSAKNMSYEQIMGCLGKKTIKQRKLMRAAQAQIDSDSEDHPAKAKLDDNDGKQNQEQGVKGNEINLAMKYRAAKDRPKAVEVCTSKIHRNGLFACQQFNPKDIVIEYVGEKIRVPVADKREKYYEKLGVGDCYLFSLDEKHIIDATFYGNKARYINHSCDPNLKSDKLQVNGENHIIFMAQRYIENGEELTFDYQFDYEAEKLECFCGSAICKGRLN